jgi:hypothetical protein
MDDDDPKIPQNRKPPAVDADPDGADGSAQGQDKRGPD